VHGDLGDIASLIRALDASQPDEVYNLAATSFVGLSWQLAEMNAETTAMGALRMLEAMRYTPMVISRRSATTRRPPLRSSVRRRSSTDGEHTVPSPQPLRGDQGLRAQHDGDLSRVRRSICLLRSSTMSRLVAGMSS